MLHQASGVSPSAGVEGCAVVGQEPLRHAVGGDALVEHGDRGVAGFPRSDQGGDRQATVVVLELEDDGLAPAGQDVLGGVQLPAGVGGRIDEPAPGRAGALAGLAAGHALAAEDPRQGRGRGGLQPHRAHLVVHPDGAVAPAPRTPARFAPPEPAGPSPGRSGSGWMPGGSSAARGPPPVPRTWPGPASRRTSCARCPARRTRRSPRPWGRRRARARSPGGHGDQHEDCVHSPRNPSGGVTAPSPRTVTDVLIQNCHRCPETSQHLPPARWTGNLRVRGPGGARAPERPGTGRLGRSARARRREGQALRRDRTCLSGTREPMRVTARV